MSFAPSYHDNQPITWFRRVPIYAATIVTALLVLGLIASVVLASARVAAPLAFVPYQFLGGYLWQIFTYPFPDMPSFFTALGILCFYSWSSEVEKYIGRGRLFTLFGLLIGAEALTCLVWWWAGVPSSAFGSYHITAALLIAFATLYPGIEFFGWVPLKWFAFVCFALGVLMYLPERNWPRLTQLCATCAAAHAYIRFVQLGGSITLPSVSKVFHRRPKIRALPDPIRRPRRARDEPESDSMSELDPLLDKIAKSGLASLTARERATLEKAREALLKKPQT